MGSVHVNLPHMVMKFSAENVQMGCNFQKITRKGVKLEKALKIQ